VQLAAVDRQRTALLAAVGHDLRTPLAGIKAAASGLRAEVELAPDERSELLSTIEDSADRLDRVVANLLDASRLEAGALAVQAEPVALDAVVGAAVLSLPGASARVSVEVPDDLPLVRVDPGLLERVLANLIDNALRHGGDGPVVVRALATETSARLEVVDRGPGGEVSFEPFQRRGDHGSGLGLGLAIAHDFVEAMGGTLIADGSDGPGLTMRLRIPLA
jgi:two-component system sensor histidine kinase KdpD